jgi:hypothetical protein
MKPVAMTLSAWPGRGPSGTAPQVDAVPSGHIAPRIAASCSSGMPDGSTWAACSAIAGRSSSSSVASTAGAS